MIKVKIIIEAEVIRKIEFTGHAFYADFGNDIVCASATTAAIVTSNAIERLYGKEAITSKASRGKITILINQSNDSIQVLLENMIDSLKDLESQYPDNIKIL